MHARGMRILQAAASMIALAAVWQILSFIFPHYLFPPVPDVIARTVEVLIDREAVRSGAAARGTPWQYFDLGHGYCTYNFFEQCPHRMACARCDFYRPKISTRAQLLEAHASLQRMSVTIPLTDDERAAVDEGADAVERLLARLADTPTPAGPSPREILPPPGPLLTITPLRHAEGA